MLYLYFLTSYIILVIVSARKPNVIYLLADDMGYGDLTSYGNPSQEFTPIDQLALEGVRFNQAYAAESSCTASRAGLLTGRYPIRSGMVSKDPHVRTLLPFGIGGLPDNETTIAEILKAEGYATGMVGKWHLGINEYNRTDGSHLPHNHGFDYVGINLPLTNNWLCDESDIYAKNGPNNRNCIIYNGSNIYQAPFEHRILTNYMVDDFKYFVSKNRDMPFFFYFAFPQLHASLFSWQTTYAESSKRGTYGGDLREMGDAVGQVVDTLRRFSLDHSTLVIFMSDHGPHREICLVGGEISGLKGGKSNHWEGGFRIPFIAWWPGRIVPGTMSNVVFRTVDLLPTVTTLAQGTLPDVQLDGVSRVNDLFGVVGDDIDRSVFYYCMTHLMAVRHGKYKLHFYKVPVIEEDPQFSKMCPDGQPSRDWYLTQCPVDTFVKLTIPELYNIDMDPLEQYSLPITGSEPKVQQLVSIASAHSMSIKMVPYQLGHVNLNVETCCSGNVTDCSCNYQPPVMELIRRYKEYIHSLSHDSV